MDWGPIISAGIQGGASLIGGLLQNSIADDTEAAAAESAKQDKILQLQLEMLKARHLGGTGGGGGGGGGANPNVLTKAQKLAAMQNQETSKVNSIGSLLAAYQNAMSIR